LSGKQLPIEIYKAGIVVEKLWESRNIQLATLEKRTSQGIVLNNAPRRNTKG
jgi:hypothetical protein